MCDIKSSNGARCRAEAKFWIQSLVTSHNVSACGRHAAKALDGICAAVARDRARSGSVYWVGQPRRAPNGAEITVKTRVDGQWL